VIWITLHVLLLLLSGASRFVVAGNHESETMNQMYGFEGEVKSKYPVYMS